jgi:hypothetical protein
MGPMLGRGPEPLVSDGLRAVVVDLHREQEEGRLRVGLVAHGARGRRRDEHGVARSERDDVIAELDVISPFRTK